MANLNNKRQGEIPDNLQQSSRSTSRNHEWLPEAISATVQELGLSSVMKKTNYEKWLAFMDETRLRKLTRQFPLLYPAGIPFQLEKAGGLKALSSPTAQLTIASWGKRRRAVQVLKELSETTSILLAAHQKDKLRHSQTVLQALAVLAMIAFVPRNEILRGDLAAILKGSPEDMPGLIKSYRLAALTGSEIVSVIDRQILNDPIWSTWVEQILKEGRDLERLCSISPCLELSEPDALKINQVEETHPNSLDDTLLGEFFSIIASIATRLTKDSPSHKNKDKIHQRQGEKP